MLRTKQSIFSSDGLFHKNNKDLVSDVNEDSSILFRDFSVESNSFDDADVNVVTSVGITNQEWTRWVKPSLLEACDTMGLTVFTKDDDSDDVDPTLVNEELLVWSEVRKEIPGCEGRMLILNTYTSNGNKMSMEDQEYLEFMISQQMELMYQDYINRQIITTSDSSKSNNEDEYEYYRPILVMVIDDELLMKKDSSKSFSKQQTTWLQHLLYDYVMDRHHLIQPIFDSQPNLTREDSTNEKSHINNQIHFQHLEMDGAMIQNYTNSSHYYWDTSDVFVLDNAIDSELQSQLLNLLKRKEWDDETQGSPDPQFWEPGGLLDLTTTAVNNDYDTLIPPSSSWGLHSSVIEKLCEYPATLPAIQRVESILSNVIYPNFIVSRMPSIAMFGDNTISPLTANAPLYGNEFQPHIDADPLLLPSSPYTDVFGKYPNRSPNKPRFVTCLLYLLDKKNDHYDNVKLETPSLSDSHSAPTKFITYDEREFYVLPRPGRIVLMDQDITHSVCPPSSSSTPPRYSIVWKLLLYPKMPGQDMKNDCLFSKSTRQHTKLTLQIMEEHPNEVKKNIPSGSGEKRAKIITVN